MTGPRPGRGCLKAKLTALPLSCNALLFVLLVAGFICFEVGRCHQEGSREMATLGEVAGSGVATSLSAGDEAGVSRALAPLKGLPRVAAAQVLGGDGALVAEYRRPSPAQTPPFPLSLPIAMLTQQRSFPLSCGAGSCGTLRLSLEPAQPEYLALFTLVVLGGALCGVLGVAFLLSRRIKRVVTDPIMHLARKMGAVSDGLDYSVRVRSWDDDELGLLFDCFNRMLAEISIRDERLALHSEELKIEVAERTRELSDVNRQLEESLEEVRRAMQSAQQANRAKSDFLAQMSHEIRTPMYGVLGMTELLLGTDLTKEQARFVETVRRSGEALLGIINNVLDFSKIEAGRMELESIPFDLHEVTADAAAMFAEDAVRKGLEIDCRIEEEVPRVVVGDPVRLRQVMVNLLGNAVKFTAHGSVRLVLDLEEKPAVVRVTITDTGIGIAPEALGRIFDQFSQADETVTRRYGGTGLGLAIAKQLTELMGGQLGVASEVGKGSTFSFTANLQPHCDPLPAERPCTALRGKRSLLVTNSGPTRQILFERMTGWGMDVECCDDARGALCKLVAAPFDLAVIDTIVAGTDGCELAATIRTVPAARSVRLVLLSATCGGKDGEPDGDGGVTYFRRDLRHERLYGTLLAALGMEPEDDEWEESLGREKRPRPVLLVEDNLVNQEVGRGMLESLGCRVEVVDNGRSAVEAVQREKYDLVFMDCQMPVMDGLEATRMIREWEEGSCTRVPIVALTAYAMKGDRIACLDSGADDYLSKPFTRDQLSRVMSRLLPPTQDAFSLEAAEAEPQHPPVEVISRDRMCGALEMIRTLPGNRGMEILRKVVELYLASTPALLQTMREAESGGDAEKLKVAAHSFKSSSANLGAMRLADKCLALETLGRAGSTQGALPLLLQVEEEYRLVREALRGGPLC